MDVSVGWQGEESDDWKKVSRVSRIESWWITEFRDRSIDRISLADEYQREAPGNS